ncbi:MAG: cation transporter [Lachnospiraceae bacterium]|nr:cation transporter [Lachnospiraceae bacterium]
MTKTISIEGMMCEHCERAVKNALEALDGVTLAEVSHEKGSAVVTLEKEVPDAYLKKAVEEEEYSVTRIV